MKKGEMLMWGDGTVSQVESLIEAADSANSKERAIRFLNQALSSAKCIKNEQQRKNFIALIEDKIRDL